MPPRDLKSYASLMIINHCTNTSYTLLFQMGNGMQLCACKQMNPIITANMMQYFCHITKMYLKNKSLLQLGWGKLPQLIPKLVWQIPQLLCWAAAPRAIDAGDQLTLNLWLCRSVPAEGAKAYRIPIYAVHVLVHFKPSRQQRSTVKKGPKCILKSYFQACIFNEL